MSGIKYREVVVVAAVAAVAAVAVVVVEKAFMITLNEAATSFVINIVLPKL